ncbi:MAG: ABC transporter ATP-binding protein [Candidatus Omnitrophica bacterium]|nr:ABC transporter ATP-binding protein [Candidatus Omnitrophota bacterium]
MITVYFRNIRSLLRLTHSNLGRFWFSIGLLMLASLFEGVSVGLFVPLLSLLMKNGDVSFMTEAPALKPLLALWPSLGFKEIFFLMLAGIVAGVTVKNGLVYASELIVSRLSRQTEHVLRTRIFDRYLSFGKLFFDRHKTGGLNELAIHQVVTACRVFEFVHSILLHACLVAVYFAAMAYLSWKLTLFSLALAPCTYLIIRIIAKKIDFSSREKFNIDQEIDSCMVNNLGNMTLIQSYTSEERESERYRRLSETARVNLNSIWKKIFFTPHAQDVVLTLALGALLVVYVLTTPRSGAGGILKVSYFLSFFIFLRRFTGSLSVIGGSLTEMTRAQEPIRRIAELFEDAGKPFVKSGGRRLDAFRDRIAFESVSFGYDGGELLKNVSLVFEQGKTTAVVGATGSGKTTLVSMIPRFYDPSAGRILLDGVPLGEYDLRSLRRQVAMVSQDTQMMNTTIRHNMTYSLEKVSEAALNEAAQKAHLYDFIMALPDRYETSVGEKGVRLSGGERQRIAIARAILKDPRIFIFDEATSALDMETELAVQKSIEELTRGRTVILVAHRLSTIRKADRIVVIEKGAVVEEGSFDELMAKKSRFHFYWSFLS